MSRHRVWLVALAVLIVFVVLAPDAFAQFGAGALESKVQGLTQKLVSVILPLFSVLGLVYAVILALSGDMAARGRIVTVIVCSIIGFLAPHIIAWFKAAAGQ